MEELAIYQKWVDCAKDAYNLLKKYPKEEKFLLAAQTREKVLQAGALITSINEEYYYDAKIRRAAQLDLTLKGIGASFRLALEFGYITEKKLFKYL